MKRIFLFFLIISGLNIHAQKVSFEYDVAGNQTKRLVCINCRQAMQDTPEDPKDLQEEDLVKFPDSNLISYYPNPVKEQLYIRWETDQKKVSNIKVTSLSGQIIKEIKNLQLLNNQIVDFFNYPRGVYIVQVKYTDGEQKSLKIIKE